MDRRSTAREWFQKGWQYDRNAGQVSLAIEAYQRCLQMDPSFSPAHVNLGFILLEQGSLEEACRSFQKVVELEPHDPEGYNNLGYAYEKMSRLGQRQTDVRTGPGGRSGQYGGLDQSGPCAGAGRRLPSGRGALPAGHFDRPPIAGPPFLLGQLYDQHDMFDEAEREYHEVLRRDPLHLKALFNLGNSTCNWATRSWLSNTCAVW